MRFALWIATPIVEKSCIRKPDSSTWVKKEAFQNENILFYRPFALKRVCHQTADEHSKVIGSVTN
jgi:hypothetical protein